MAHITPEQISALQTYVDQRLRQLCRTEETPTREQLIATVRDIWPRFGWSLVDDERY